METIESRLREILDKIRSASSGRQDVKLIAVSKTKPVSSILEAFKAGQLHFGENRIQEARDKSPQTPQSIHWHLIGPLQKNKAKYCPQIFSTLHTLHRTDIADNLNQKLVEADKTIDVLIQMNLSGESSKSGVEGLDELKRLQDHILTLPNLRLTGLMTMGDPNADAKVNQKIFSDLREILSKEAFRLELKNQYKELSMGMSGDFELAIKEGATFVRIGSSIFGTR
ncbi:MAG: YggS family pyridoxal phosphate-dependent enzyme [Deltaproteobacteria bacterium]|nr:YggS family pyridoxal phosphate-dependent enzyme [Deltaproteobacteria bacterium]